jgi:hypothetical protein
MGVAYFIVLDNPNPGFPTRVNGKAIGRASSTIDGVARRLGLKTIDEFACFAAIGQAPKQTEVPWFDAQEGLDWVLALRHHFESGSSTIKNAQAILDDLVEYEEVLLAAATIGARWHFEMDV